MRKNPLIKIVTFTKHKGFAGLFPTLKVQHMPIAQVQQHLGYIENDLALSNCATNQSKAGINEDSVNYTSFNLHIEDEDINLKICNPCIPFSYSVNQFAEELYLTDALIVDMQPVEVNRSITSLEVINFIKKIRKSEPLLPILLIINADANQEFLHHISIGIEYLNINILYKKLNETLYPLAIEVAARLSSRPRDNILKFYEELRTRKHVPLNAKLENLINKAQDGQHPEYTRIANELKWLTVEGDLTNSAKKLLLDERCYANQIDINYSFLDSVLNLSEQAIDQSANLPN